MRSHRSLKVSHSDHDNDFHKDVKKKKHKEKSSKHKKEKKVTLFIIN